MRDVAQAAGVSTMAVSLALRGSGSLSTSTAQRIRETALRLGYMPNPKLSVMMSEVARTRYTDRSGTLAYVVTEPMSDGLNPAVERGVRTAAARARLYGYNVEPFWLTDPALPARRLNQILWNRGIEGMAIPNISGEFYARGVHTLPIEWEKFCVVEIGGSMLQPAVNRVRHDHYGGIIKAIHRLEQLGYRRIGLCQTREVDLRTHHRWSAAYLLWQAVREGMAGLRPLLVDEIVPERVVSWVRENCLDAVLSPGTEFLMALRTGGLSVPEEIGFASLDIFGPEATKLSGINQDEDLLIASAVDLIVTLVERRERGVPEHPTEILSVGHWQEGDTLRALQERLPSELLDLDSQTLTF